jgi:ribosomal protein L16 Arg81 hydroxylase
MPLTIASKRGIVSSLPAPCTAPSAPFSHGRTVSSAVRDFSSVGRFGLDRLLRPYTPSVFFNRYWERQPLVINRGDTNYYGDLLSIRDFDSLLCTVAPNARETRVVRTINGKVDERNVEAASEKCVNVFALYDSYRQGYTLIVNAVDLRWPPVAHLCRGLEAEIRHGIGANLYFTPAKAQGFAAHFDSHDVFILQLQGEKVWSLYQPSVALPTTETKAGASPKKPGGVAHKGVLKPGDLLYIPRGHVHAAKTSAGSSLHLTVGIHAFLWRDLLLEAVRQAAERDVELRRAVRFDRIGSEQDAGRLVSRGRRLLNSISRSMREILPSLDSGGRVLDGRTPAPDGHFASLDRAADIRLNTLVRRRNGMRCTVSRQGDRAFIQFPGNHVSAPAAVEPALHYIANVAEPFQVQDLPDLLTDRSKCLLASRLIGEGLLRVERSIERMTHEEASNQTQRRKARREGSAGHKAGR